MKQTYFITGTDTDIGKTYVTVKLLQILSTTRTPNSGTKTHRFRLSSHADGLAQ